MKIVFEKRSNILAKLLLFQTIWENTTKQNMELKHKLFLLGRKLKKK